MIGPTVSGFTARWNKKYPSVFGENWFFNTFPYFLPCACCCVLLLTNIITCAISMQHFPGKNKKKTRKQAIEDELKASLPLKKKITAEAKRVASAICKLDVLNLLWCYFACCMVFYIVEYVSYNTLV